MQGLFQSPLFGGAVLLHSIMVKLVVCSVGIIHSFRRAVSHVSVIQQFISYVGTVFCIGMAGLFVEESIPLGGCPVTTAVYRDLGSCCTHH